MITLCHVLLKQEERKERRVGEEDTGENYEVSGIKFRANFGNVKPCLARVREEVERRRMKQEV